MYAESGCTKTANEAAQHAVAKAAYDATLEKTGCSKTAEKAYDEALKTSEPIQVAAK